MLDFMFGFVDRTMLASMDTDQGRLQVVCHQGRLPVVCQGKHNRKISGLGVILRTYFTDRHSHCLYPDIRISLTPVIKRIVG